MYPFGACAAPAEAGPVRHGGSTWCGRSPTRRGSRWADATRLRAVECRRRRPSLYRHRAVRRAGPPLRRRRRTCQRQPEACQSDVHPSRRRRRLRNHEGVVGDWLGSARGLLGRRRERGSVGQGSLPAELGAQPILAARCDQRPPGPRRRKRPVSRCPPAFGLYGVVVHGASRGRRFARCPRRDFYTARRGEPLPSSIKLRFGEYTVFRFPFGYGRESIADSQCLSCGPRDPRRNARPLGLRCLDDAVMDVAVDRNSQFESRISAGHVRNNTTVVVLFQVQALD